ncbi:SusD/RagB family nutrient-binding outer membrane lipoprotein [Rapidithrix thailandica]|uniref:SusD/RagB family nutrient-binding outer membrane lipoprotein n=1 Tax=Rapidithrix thailandica TaxID=413964 RepID=A0AAW9S3R5_9BACT
MRITYKFFTLLLVCLFSYSSCTDFVEGYQDDPNNPTDAPVNTLMTVAFTGMIIPHSGEDARLACMWSRQFTGTDRQYSGYNVYSINSEDFEWDKFYFAIIQQANLVIERAPLTNNRILKGMALTIKAHAFGVMISLWGDAPYFEANQLDEFPDPNFDSQVTVYAEVQKLLDEAIADLESDIGDDLGVDFYFNGDTELWIKAARTLKARFYMHTKNYAAAKTQAEMGILTVADDMMIPHGGTYIQDMNIYHSFLVIDRDTYMGARGAILPQMLDANKAWYRGDAKTDESKRFAYIYTPPSSPELDDYGINTGSEGIFASNASFKLVTCEENLLILAETLLREDDLDGALEALNKVRQLHATQFEATYDDYVAADFEAGGIANLSGKTASESMMYEILEEKYISLVGQIEVFNDIRRTDNLLGLPPTTGTQLPERFLIPQDEINANANIPGNRPDIFTPTAVNQ